MDSKDKDQLINLIGSQAGERQILIPMELAVDIAIELERLDRIRKALEPDLRDY